MNALALDLVRERYRQHLEVLNYSSRTIITQATYFNRLGEFMAEVKHDDLAAFTAQTLTDFQRWLFYQPTAKGAARTIASQNRVLSFTRGLFAFLHAEGLITYNPAATLKLAREPDPLPKNVLTPQEARKIVEAPDTATLEGYRDRTILEVLYSTGIRKKEVLSLTVDDISLDDEVAIVRNGKGGKDRVVPLSRQACRHLETYLKSIRPEMLRGFQTRALFVSIRLGYTLGVHSLGTIIDRYTRKAGVKRKVTAHLWRHTCATHLLKNNANLRHVQELLGHRSLATTERYLRLTITDLKEAHRKFHPREKDTRRRA
jgi:integrase/recombinase XerD